MRHTVTLILALLIGFTFALLATGHLLVFTTPPIQVCVGWADDAVPSWACTPDYTTR